MLTEIARFELKYHLRSPLFYILLLVYFLLTFAAVTTDAVQIGGSVGNVNRNAPFVIMQFLLMMSIFGVLTTTAFVANSVHRDFELKTDALFFSSPIGKFDYLAGRFSGSFIVSILVYLGVVLAIMIGSLMPWIEKERLGPFELWPYVFSLFVLVVPNLLLAGAIFFAVAALTRSMMATYASVVAFFVLYGVAGSLLSDMENESLAALLDPFGFGAFSVATRYWTVFDRNTQLISLEGVYLWNRLLWLAIAVTILALAFWRFRFTAAERGRKKRAAAAVNEYVPIQRIALELPAVTQTFGRAASWRQCLATLRLEVVSIFKSIPFIIMLMLGVLNIWGNSIAMQEMFGTAVYPVTHLMIEAIYGAFAIFAMLIAAFYTGDIVWRERNLNLSEVTDAMPLPSWAQWVAKLSAVIVVVVTSLAAAIATAIVIQISRGYYNFELGVYARGVFLGIGVWLILVTILAFVMQVLFNQKYVAFLGVMAYFIIARTLPALDFEHRLYRFASVPPSQYSDMNGYGHFVAPVLWFNTYWILFAAMLIVGAHLLWVRGTEEGFRTRLTLARKRFGRPVGATLAVLLVAFASTGCYIYYNTNVLNPYRTTKDNERRIADAEKKYKQFEGTPQPRITAVKADVDIFPERRAVQIRGEYTLVNRTDAPISELHVSHSPDTLTTLEIALEGARLKRDDRDLGYAIYTLDQPMEPGASLTLRFSGGYEARGFANGAANNNVVENGTFINSFSYFPHLGYNRTLELQDRNKRRKHGLPPIERMKSPDDLQARMNNYISAESDWLSLDTTVSTSVDQIALAPGYLQREWTDNGRRYFHYKTTSPILGFWSYLSARYEVKRDSWNGIPIEVYYDAKHPYNVDRMIDSVKKSLDYFTTHFSPYQHRQIRILEFPGYSRFAQSFPNTIPYSESIGFIADLRDAEKIDYVFYVTAHEVAHQWWAHQVIGGNVQGSTVLSETLSQYSALMVMEKEYGPEKMQKFLKYELDRYLRDRGSELVAEMPLVLVENQGYIHYRKGSLVMYALRDALGEERVNAALAKFIRDHGFSGPPYPTATQHVSYLREVAKPEHQNLITDLFERIVIYDTHTREATATRRDDGSYLVTLKVSATKFVSDAQGEEKEVPINDWIDLAVFAGKDTVLFSEKRLITQPEETFEIVVREKPSRAGIDPFNKLIDRNPKDNTKGL